MKAATFLRRRIAGLVLVPLLLILIGPALAGARQATPEGHEAHHATPTTDPCAALGVATPAAMPGGHDATPMAGQDDEAIGGQDGGAMGDMAVGTPHAGMMGTPGAGMAVEFDQFYIDMMIPHHASIIAMAQAALPRLSDPRLIAIAEAIIATQSAEIEELRGYREAFYGSPEPVAMDMAMMEMMMGSMMPETGGGMESMMFQMDAAAQVAAICASATPDLTFIDLTLPHHQMAIVASEMALMMATHPEIRDFAQRVIDAQQAENEELSAIRAELSGEETLPASPEA